MAVRNGSMTGEMMVRLRGTADEVKADYWTYMHPDSPEAFSMLFRFQDIKHLGNKVKVIASDAEHHQNEHRTAAA